MKVGFTGTQQGMSQSQKKAFVEFLNSIKMKEFHHGDCIGADSDAHNLVVQNMSVIVEIHVHPPIKNNKRAFNCGKVLYPAMDYLSRNREIVDLTDILIATPKGFVMENRSGTWYTVRYAGKVGRRILIIFPDGSLQERI